MNYISLKWFFSKITLREVLPLSLKVIGREDSRNIEAIAASSRGLGIKEVCVFDGEIFFFICSFLVYFLSTSALWIS